MLGKLVECCVMRGREGVGRMLGGRMYTCFNGGKGWCVGVVGSKGSVRKWVTGCVVGEF